MFLAKWKHAVSFFAVLLSVLLCAVGCSTGTQTEKGNARSSASGVEEHSDLSSQAESEQEQIEPSEEILALIAE